MKIYMVHGLYGYINWNASFMAGGKCTKNYPKKFYFKLSLVRMGTFVIVDDHLKIGDFKLWLAIMRLILDWLYLTVRYTQRNSVLIYMLNNVILENLLHGNI